MNLDKKKIAMASLFAIVFVMITPVFEVAKEKVIDIFVENNTEQIKSTCSRKVGLSFGKSYEACVWRLRLGEDKAKICEDKLREKEGENFNVCMTLISLGKEP